MNKRRKVGLGVLATALAIGVMAPVEAHAEKGGNVTRAVEENKYGNLDARPLVKISSNKYFRVQNKDVILSDDAVLVLVEEGSTANIESIATVESLANVKVTSGFIWEKGKEPDFSKKGDYYPIFSASSPDEVPGASTDDRVTQILFHVKVVDKETFSKASKGGFRKLGGKVGDKERNAYKEKIAKLEAEQKPEQNPEQKPEQGEQAPAVKGEKPVITLDKDLSNEVEYGAEFDPMKGVTAEDKEDGTLTDKITMEGKVDTKVPGDYKIVYNVEDKDGNKTSIVREVKVKENPNPGSPEERPVIGKAPVIEGANDLTLVVGQKFEPMKDVKATDEEDGDLTEKVQVDASKVDTSKVGDYVAVYTVEDKDGNITKVERKVQVKELENAGLPTNQGSGANGLGLPKTGAVATGALGAIGVAGGAGAVFFKKRH